MQINNVLLGQSKVIATAVAKTPLAVALVNGKQAARVPEKSGRPATEYFDPLWVLVLSRWRYRQDRALTVRELILALGRLGGHLNRKCDGLPGWQTLWRGAMKLHAMVEYELARQSADAEPGAPRQDNDELSRPSIGKL